MRSQPTVAVARCQADTSDAEVRDCVAGAIHSAIDLNATFAGKNKVLVKPNAGIKAVRVHSGRQISLTDAAVLAGTVATIREAFAGEILVADASTGVAAREVYEALGYYEALKDLGVRLVDPNEGPYVEMKTPGGGLMFSSYAFSELLQGVDAVVSVAKMKSHVSAGVTLGLKNLFGLPPCPIYGAPRRYLHAPVRLPRVLVDVGSIFPPALTVIDGLVAQDEREWGGPPVRMDLLLAGSNVVATDSAAARIMGADPEADFGVAPFLFDSNPLKLAAGAGLGPNSPDGYRVVGDDPASFRRAFRADRSDLARCREVRRAVSREALGYLERRERLMVDYQGRYVALAEGKVLAQVQSVNELRSRTELSKQLDSETAGIYLKKVERADSDPERMDIYNELAA